MRPIWLKKILVVIALPVLDQLEMELKIKKNFVINFYKLFVSPFKN
jgi:hypothetical protein